MVHNELNHSSHRFDARSAFLLQDGTSKCRACGCVARSHVGVLIYYTTSESELVSLDVTQRSPLGGALRDIPKTAAKETKSSLV